MSHHLHAIVINVGKGLWSIFCLNMMTLFARHARNVEQGHTFFSAHTGHTCITAFYFIVRNEIQRQSRFPVKPQSPFLASLTVMTSFGLSMYQLGLAKQPLPLQEVSVSLVRNSFNNVLPGTFDDKPNSYNCTQKAAYDRKSSSIPCIPS